MGANIQKTLTLLGMVGGGIAMVAFVIWFLKRKLAKDRFESVDASPYMMAIALESVLKGQPSAAALAKLVYDTLRFGNYRAYRGAFVTGREVESLFDADKAASICNSLKDEGRLKTAFEQMRREFFQHHGEFAGVEFRREIPLTTPDGKSVSTLLEESFILLGEGDPPEMVHLGTLVKSTFGWKILLPKFELRREMGN